MTDNIKRGILSGGSGFLGRALAEHFLHALWDVVILTRTPNKTGCIGRQVAWDACTIGPWQRELDGASAVVNSMHQHEYWACRLIGLLVRDVLITRQEIRGLMEGRLYMDAPPLGTTKLTEWIAQNRNILARRYTSEMARRTDRISSYQSN